MSLTESGLNEIAERESGTSVDVNGKKKAVNVDPQRVLIAKQFILSGRTDEEINILSQSFSMEYTHES